MSPGEADTTAPIDRDRKPLAELAWEATTPSKDLGGVR